MTTRTRSHRSLLLRLLALLAIVTFIGAACGGGDDDDGDAEGVQETETEDEGDPKPGGEVSIALEAESAGWQPCVDSHSESGTMVMSAIYDPLMARDHEGNVKPFLAESLTKDSETQYTMKLRKGVKFHDGTDLNAQAVKDNFDAAKLPASRCFAALAPVKEMQIVDDLTVKYVLNGPYGPFPELLTGAAGTIFSPANAKAKGPDVSANPVGTGPFVFKSWQRDAELVVEKNPNYWFKPYPYLDRVKFRPVPDEEARLTSLTSGEVQLMHTLRQQTVKLARDEGDSVKRYEFVGNNCGGSIFNTAKPPVDDKRVRKALAYAVNQEELIAVLGGEGISPKCTQFFSKDSPWYSEDIAKAWPENNPEEGKKLLAQYVNDPKRSDGKPAGAAVAVDFNCPPDPTLIAVSQAYQQQAKAIGIEMNLNQVEQAKHINNAVGAAPFTQADYMINCWRLGGQADPDSVLFNSYNKPEGNAANVTNFSSEEVQRLLKIGRESSDLDERKKAYEDLHKIFNEEVPHLWTGATVTAVVTAPEVKGIALWKYPNGDEAENGFEQSVVRFRYVWLDQ